MCTRVKGELEEGSGNIRVVIKVGPPNQRELALPGGVIVEVMDDYKQVVVTGRPPFSYDVAFPTPTTQLETFERIGVDVVATAYNGYNASMFACKFLLR